MKYVVTHENKGVMIGMLPAGTCWFTKDEGRPSDVEGVMGFENEGEARMLVVDQWNDVADRANLNVVGLNVANATVTFDELREAGLGHLLDDDAAPKRDFR